MRRPWARCVPRWPQQTIGSQVTRRSCPRRCSSWSTATSPRCACRSAPTRWPESPRNTAWSKPSSTAVAIRDGKFLCVGTEADVMPLAGAATRVIDLGKRRVLPGLIDNHLHIIRGGLNFNMELRWDGVRSLGDAMAMLKRQVAVTPPPQWVRVVGGFTEHQFVEKRLPTIEELNAVAPDTPVFLLHLYDRALLNAAALRAVGYTKATPEPPGGQIVRDGS